MTQQDYLIAWALYIASCAGLIWIGWSWTCKIRPAIIRRCIRVIAIVALLMPYQSYPDKDDMAPALIILVFESVLNGPESAMRVVIPLSTALGTGIFLAIIYSIVFRKKTDRSSGDMQKNL